MNETYPPSGNHYHLTFQPHAVYRFNLTERDGRKNPRVHENGGRGLEIVTIREYWT